MVKTRCIVWDWNGTIIDDNPLCYSIANRMLRERGLPPVSSRRAYKRIFRFPVKDYYYDMGYTFESETYESVAAEFTEYYTSEYMNCPLQPHARRMIRKFRDMGISQILISATGQENLEQQVAAFRLDHAFDILAGQKNDLAFSKADRVRQIFHETGLKKDETLFVGDTDHDFDVAEAVGARCVLTDRGHQLRGHLMQCGVPVIHSLKELEDYI